MRTLLLLIPMFLAGSTWAAPIHVQFDARTESLHPSLGTHPGLFRGDFWFDTRGTVQRNTLLGFPGTEIGYTYAAPSQAGGIFLGGGLGSGPVLIAEARDYDAALTNAPDELSIRSVSVFESVTITFRGADASFFETESKVAPSLPVFDAGLPFLPYAEAWVEIADHGTGTLFFAQIDTDSVGHWDPLAPEPEGTPLGGGAPGGEGSSAGGSASMPEPGTALLFGLGLLALALRRKAPGSGGEFGAPR